MGVAQLHSSLLARLSESNGGSAAQLPSKAWMFMRKSLRSHQRFYLWWSFDVESEVVKWKASCAVQSHRFLSDWGRVNGAVSRVVCQRHSAASDFFRPRPPPSQPGTTGNFQFAAPQSSISAAPNYDNRDMAFLSRSQSATQSCIRRKLC